MSHHLPSTNGQNIGKRERIWVICVYTLLTATVNYRSNLTILLITCKKVTHVTLRNIIPSKRTVQSLGKVISKAFKFRQVYHSGASFRPSIISDHSEGVGVALLAIYQTSYSDSTLWEKYTHTVSWRIGMKT